MVNKIIVSIIFFCVLLFSCTKKDIIENDIKRENTNTMSLLNLFKELDKNKPLEKLSMEYYKNIILQHNSSRGYVDIINIFEVEYFIPGYLCFIVYWRTGEGYVYKLYAFGLYNNEQKISEIYNLNNGWPSPYMEIIMERIPGKRLGEYLIIDDINDDQLNEIIGFSFGSFGSVFTIYGFDLTNNDITKYCEIQYFVNYDKPFTSIIFENGTIKILEIVDRENYDLMWNEYIWNEMERKYGKK
jgi:hypothetical protein